MLDALTTPFADYAFMRKALAGCVCLAFGAAPLGIFLIQRRLSLSGEAIAHAILPGVAIGYLIGGLSLLWMTVGGMGAAIAVAALAGAAADRNLPTDASMAVFYLGSLAVGVLIISAAGTNIDMLTILFGSILAIGESSLILLAGVATLTLATVALFYRLLVMDSLDPTFRRVAGPAAMLVGAGFMVLVAANLVAGFQAFGTLMSLSLIILPAAAARFWSWSIALQIVWSALFGVLGSLGGLLVSFHFSVVASSSIALILLVVFLVSFAFGPQHSLLAKIRNRSFCRAGPQAGQLVSSCRPSAGIS